MALYQSYGGATLSGYTKAYDGNQVFNKFDQRIRRKKVDIAALIKAAGVANVAVADKVAVMPVYNGEVIKAVYFRIITPSTAAGNASVVDSAAGVLLGTSGVTAGAASASGGVWTGAIASNGTAGLFGPSMAAGSILANGGTAPVTGGNGILAGLGKFYTANGSLDLLTSTAALVDGVYEVIAEFLEIFPQATN